VNGELNEALGAAAPPQRLCTLRMARRLLPALRRRNLDALSRHYGIPNHARHRADGDALATARVLLRLLEQAETQGAHDLDGLERLLSGGAPGRRKRRRKPPP
jgi:DNA polymerase-3 subunit epsilon